MVLPAPDVCTAACTMRWCHAQMQWSALNSFIALLGYYAAAWLVDKPW